MVKSMGDKVFDVGVYVILALVGLAALFPMLYVISVSLTPFGEVLRNGGYVIIPQSITFDAYRQFLTKPEIPRAFGVTTFITVVGTLINLLLTTLMAYPLSKKNLPGRRWLLLLVVWTLLFNGGIIPTYLVVKSVGLLDTVWAMILPSAIWSTNVLIMKSFFESLPEEVFESARLDGASEFRIVWQIVLPLSTPVMLTIGLFYAVSHWNEFFQALLYITDHTLQPLQIVVRNLLRQSQSVENPESLVPTTTLQMAAVVIATLPVIIVYPFIQKHFTKGALLGSLKG
jgi:putative aldouronate transport system permease protein